MSVYETNPNQRLINTTSAGHEVCDKEHIYLMQQKEAMFKAMKDLTPTNFQVWLYIASQKKDYTFGFSPAAVTKETGIKKSSLQEGIRVLIEHRYLVQRADGSNIFEFYEIPREKEVETEEMQIHTNATAAEPIAPSNEGFSF